jgi:hypothetical protein
MLLPLSLGLLVLQNQVIIINRVNRIKKQRLAPMEEDQSQVIL